MGLLEIRQNNAQGALIASENRLTKPSATWGGVISGKRTFSTLNKVMDRNLVIGGKSLTTKDKVMPYNVFAQYNANQPYEIFADGAWKNGFSANSFSYYGHHSNSFGDFIPSFSLDNGKIKANFPYLALDASVEYTDEDIYAGIAKLKLPLPIDSVKSVEIKVSDRGGGYGYFYPFLCLVNEDLSHDPSYASEVYWYLNKNDVISRKEMSIGSVLRGVRAAKRVETTEGYPYCRGITDAYAEAYSSSSGTVFAVTPTKVTGDTDLWLYLSFLCEVNGSSHYGERWCHIDYIKINTK